MLHHPLHLLVFARCHFAATNFASSLYVVGHMDEGMASSSWGVNSSYSGESSLLWRRSHTSYWGGVIHPIEEELYLLFRRSQSSFESGRLCLEFWLIHWGGTTHPRGETDFHIRLPRRFKLTPPLYTVRLHGLTARLRMRLCVRTIAPARNRLGIALAMETGTTGERAPTKHRSLQSPRPSANPPQGRCDHASHGPSIPLHWGGSYRGAFLRKESINNIGAFT